MNEPNRTGNGNSNGNGHRIYLNQPTPKVNEPQNERRERHTSPNYDRPNVGSTVAKANRDGTLNFILLISIIMFGISLLIFISIFALSANFGTTSNIDDPSADTEPLHPAVTVAVAPENTSEPLPATDPEATAPDSPVTSSTADSIKLISGVYSTYAVLMDSETGDIIASRNGSKTMFPASMTKIMTLIVARENISDLSQSLTFSKNMLYSIELDAMKVGFKVGERVNAIDLMYGAMLPSGCDATLGISTLVAGGEDQFAELMNLKSAELGLTGTHFSNSSGLYSADNYSTVADIAKIFKYALNDELMRQIICSDSYVINSTLDGVAEQHKLTDRLRLNINEYSAAYGSVKLKGFTMLGGKTGYIDQSGSCLASYSVDGNGRHYIVVTGKARNMSEVLADHYRILMEYAK